MLLWLRALQWRVSITAKLLWIILVVGSFPAIQGFKLQQLTLLVAALLAAAMACMVQRRFVIAGILLAIASIKPQLLLLLAMWMIIWISGNWRERRKVFWSAAACIAVLLGGSEFLLPGWISEFRRAMSSYYQYTGGGRSILDVAISPTWGRVASAALVLALMLLLWKLRREPEGTSGFSVVHLGCPRHDLDYRSHVRAIQSSPVGALCDVGAERVPHALECEPVGAVFRNDRCRLPCLAVRLSGGFGVAWLFLPGSDGSASLARADGYDVDDPSFASRVNSCRSASDLLHIQRTERASHGKHIAQQPSLRSRLRRSAAAEYSGGAAEAECGGIPPKRVTGENTHPWLLIPLDLPAITAPASGVFPALVFVQGSEQKNIILNRTPFTVGRKVDKDLVIADPRVSRDHAQIDAGGTRFLPAGSGQQARNFCERRTHPAAKTGARRSAGIRGARFGLRPVQSGECNIEHGSRISEPDFR